MYVLMLVNSRKLCCSSLLASLVVKFDQIFALARLECGVNCVQLDKPNTTEQLLQGSSGARAKT